MAQHPTDIPGFPTPMHAAEYIENLRYDSLALFLLELKRALTRRAEKDYKAKKFQLASKLDQASANIAAAHYQIERAWSICAPYISKEPIPRDHEPTPEEFAEEIVENGVCSYEGQTFDDDKIPNCWNAGEFTMGGIPCMWCKAKKFLNPGDDPATFKR